MKFFLYVLVPIGLLVQVVVWGEKYVWPTVQSTVQGWFEEPIEHVWSEDMEMFGHPGYAKAQEEVFDLIPKILYEANVDQVSGYPINSEKMTVINKYARGEKRKPYDLWALIAEHESPILFVGNTFRQDAHVDMLVPKDLDEAVWIPFFVRIADPQSYTKRHAAMHSYVPHPATRLVIVRVKLAPTQGSESTSLDIQEIVLRGDNKSYKGFSAWTYGELMQRNVFGKSHHVMPYVNKHWFHALTDGAFAPGLCERKYSEGFCEQLWNRSRDFPTNGYLMAKHDYYQLP